MTIYYDFGFYLSVAAIVTGVIALIDKLKWQKERQAKGVEYDEKGNEKLPFMIDISRSFFPIILFVLVLRSFLYEPYRIPSGSMNPGLYDGDFILVNKYAYGIRLPAFNTKIIPIGEPKRGDVIVFHPPHEPQSAYIKRLIGMPGDRLEWNKGTLTITPKCEEGKVCQPIVIKPQLKSSDVNELVKQGEYFDTYQEVIGEVEYETIYLDPRVDRGSLKESWTRVVPDGKYFGVGDNRDNSMDSRVWGFIDQDAMIGRAAAKWLFMEFTDEPVMFGWHLPKGISFARVGAIN
ncbi:MAG: signal peptidase I [Kangiellaceae bacterium]|nr:signal peptidase I [Kangiellaceae bacterium]